MTVEELRQYLNLSEKTVYSFVKSKGFLDKVAMKEPRKKSWVIDETALQKWIIRQKELARNEKKRK